MKGHHRLKVWKRSVDYVVEIYNLTKRFPVAEQYGLNSQMRRAALSIASNIAEGAGRNSRKEFRQFLSIAQGSVAELETQLIIAERLGYCTNIGGFLTELDEISKMIIGLKKKV
ncbi:MAG: four helix bundle protein [Deltaproteobacteria bacterium]|nr:four helix bundle protein [Deltaproteobacteria bacterium]MBW2138544.1 four helix bundle protein [Deltaproteobacteria bacterium]